MNERILELAEQAWDSTAVSPDFGHPVSFVEKFAELIIKDCVDTLEFHGFEDAVPYIKWMATNKLGVEQ